MTGSIDANPFVGPRPIEEGHALYGRAEELSELFHQFQARRIVLLHSPSGAGKSSLVQAGLIPRLRNAKFDVWPPIRVNHSVRDRGGLPEGTNRYLLSAMLSLEAELPLDKQRTEAQLAAMDFGVYLDSRPRKKRNQGRPVALIFDQFEEILTTDARAVVEKRVFFDDVGQALDGGDYWALFVMREDYLGALAPYRDRIPTQLSNTFRLDMLTREAAREAAENAARDGGRTFPAVDRLIADLSRTTIQMIDGEEETMLGLYVEPVHLQVVCHRLWLAMPEAQKSIDAEHIAAFADVSTALAGYYAETVAAAAGGDDARERAIREWVGGRLVEGGVRTPVRRDTERSAGLDNRLIGALVDRYLVRSEQRAGATWYELSHDRMVEPVLLDNARWEEAHLHAFQAQAKVWERARRPSSLLLPAGVVASAVAWAKENPDRVTDSEAEFLALSKDRRDRRVARQRLEGLVFGLVLLLMVASMYSAYQANLAQNAAVAAGTQAKAEKDEADRQRRVAEEQQALAKASAHEAQRNEAEANTQRDEARRQKEKAAEQQALAEAAASKAQEQEAVALDAREEADLAAADAKAARDDTLRLLAASKLAKDPAAALPFLAEVKAPGAATGWRESAQYALEQTLPVNILRTPDPSEKLTAVAMTDDHSAVVGGTREGRILIWSGDRGVVAQVVVDGAPSVRELAVSPTGDRVAWISDDAVGRAGLGRAWLWRSPGGAPVELPGPVGTGAWALAFSADGTLAIGRSDGSVGFLRANDEVPSGALPSITVNRRVFSLAWAGPSRRLVVASDTEIVVIEDFAAPIGDTLPQPRFRLGPARHLSKVVVSPDGTRIVALADDDGVWHGILSGEGELTHIRAHEPIESVAFVGTGNALAIGYRNGAVGYWGAKKGPGYELEVRFRGHAGSVRDLSGSRDGRRFASASEDGTIRLWPVTPRVWSEPDSLDGLVDDVQRVARTVCAAARDRVKFLQEDEAAAERSARACANKLGF